MFDILLEKLVIFASDKTIVIYGNIISMLFNNIFSTKIKIHVKTKNSKKMLLIIEALLE